MTDGEHERVVREELSPADLEPEAGGRVIRLVGNHELMRAEGSLRDAHPAESSAAAVAGVMQWKVDVKSGAVRASYSDGPYFFTHAGVRPALLERLPTPSIGELVSYLNDRLRDAVRNRFGAIRNHFARRLDGRQGGRWRWRWRRRWWRRDRDGSDAVGITRRHDDKPVGADGAASELAIRRE